MQDRWVRDLPVNPTKVSKISEISLAGQKFKEVSKCSRYVIVYTASDLVRDYLIPDFGPVYDK